MWHKKWQYLVLRHMNKNIIDYMFWCAWWPCPQLTGGETEAQTGKASSLTCQATAQVGLSIRETNAMQIDLFFLTLHVSLSAKLLFLAIELCVCHESYNKKNWRAVKQSLVVSSERYWGLPAVSRKSFREPCVLKSASPLLRESWVLYTRCGVWIAPEVPFAEKKHGLFALH